MQLYAGAINCQPRPAGSLRSCKSAPGAFVEPRGSHPTRVRFTNKKPPPCGEGFYLAHPEGFEPPTKWFEATYSIQLSYGCMKLVLFERGEKIPALAGKDNRRHWWYSIYCLVSNCWRKLVISCSSADILLSVW